MHELKEFSSDEKASYCLIPVTKDTLVALKAYAITESQKQVIDKMLPTL